MILSTYCSYIFLFVSAILLGVQTSLFQHPRNMSRDLQQRFITNAIFYATNKPSSLQSFLSTDLLVTEKLEQMALRHSGKNQSDTILRDYITEHKESVKPATRCVSQESVVVIAVLAFVGLLICAVFSAANQSARTRSSPVRSYFDIYADNPYGPHHKDLGIGLPERIRQVNPGRDVEFVEMITKN